MYGRDAERGLLSGNYVRYRSRQAAEIAARRHLNSEGGGEAEIQNPDGAVIRTEPVPPPEWWLGEPSDAAP